MVSFQLIQLDRNNFYINNLDINLICEKPKISKYRDKIIKSLSLISLTDSVYAIGGHDGTGPRKSLFKMSCESNACEWTKMTQELQVARSLSVAMLIPNELAKCTIK